MTLLMLLNVLSLYIYVSLVIYILHKDHRSLLNRIYAAFSLCFVLWSFEVVFAQSPYTPLSTVKAIDRISNIGWLSFSSFFLWLCVVIVDNKKILKNKLFYLMIFIIPLIFVYEQVSHQSIVGYSDSYFGWKAYWKHTKWTSLYFVYYNLFMFSGIYLLYKSQKNSNHHFKKVQAWIIIISTSFSVLAGTVTDVILPGLGINDIPSVGSLVSLVWAFGIFFAMMKYNFLAINPVTASASILSTINDCVILLNPDREIVSINNSALTLFDYEKKQLLGKPVEILFKDKEYNNKLIIMASKGEVIYNKETELISMRKKSIPVLFSISVLKDDFKNLAGFVCIARDITGEKAAAKEKEGMERRMSQSEKMAAVGQLAGGVAHEINNPMTVILGYTQIVLKRTKSEDPLSKPLLAIEKEAIRCKKLIDNLLTFSRASKMMKQLTGLNKTIKDAMSLIEVQTKIKNIDIVEEYGENLPDMMIDVNQIQQIIINLCNNAMDSMPEGGMIKINTSLDDKFIKIIVSDTGIGISEENKKRLFEPFFTTKEVGKGTGLGLSICYEIVKKHNGEISVESEAGKGTIFTIHLPVVTEKEAPLSIAQEKAIDDVVARKEVSN